MNYLSRPDRRAETEPAEERSVEITLEPSRVGAKRCSWCSRWVRAHSPEDLARCEEMTAFRAERIRREVLGEPRSIPPSELLRRGRRL